MLPLHCFVFLYRSGHVMSCHYPNKHAQSCRQQNYSKDTAVRANVGGFPLLCQRLSSCEDRLQQQSCILHIDLHEDKNKNRSVILKLYALIMCLRRGLSWFRHGLQPVCTRLNAVCQHLGQFSLVFDS